MPRNAGESLDLDRVLAVRVNRSAAERRAATIPTRRTVKKEWQAAWLLRAVTLMDLTTLSGDDTPGNVRRLCAKARQPDLVEALGAASLAPKVAAVCVYHREELKEEAAEVITRQRGSGPTGAGLRLAMARRLVAGRETSAVRRPRVGFARRHRRGVRLRRAARDGDDVRPPADQAHLSRV
jgi:hypothetical protein